MQLVIYVDVYGRCDDGLGSVSLVSGVLTDIVKQMSYGASLAEVAQHTFASADGTVEATLEWTERMSDDDIDDLYEELGGT